MIRTCLIILIYCFTPPTIMPVDPSANKKGFRLCLCSSHDCKGQKWEDNDGSIRNGKWVSIMALTEKYGPQVFGLYNLNFGTNNNSGGESSGARADSDDSGESVGSGDSGDESDGDSAGSFIINDEGAMDDDEQGFRDEDDGYNSTFDASFQMAHEAEIFDDSSSDEKSM